MSKPDNSRWPDRDRVVVIWAGDINLGRRQHYQTASIGAENVLGGIPALRTADLRIANLECVVATAGEQGIKGSKNAPYYYRARPDMLRILTGAHIDIVATANNHSGDYGPEALLEQGRWLDAVGIGHAGTGPHLEAALQPVLRRAGHLNVALFSLDATQPRFAATQDSPGSAHLDPDLPDLWRETLTPRITAIRDQAHVVLMAVHWGRNHADTPEPRTRALARAIIDAGADAVLGCSAHWVQGAEIDRQRPILYDAGNLLFDSVRNTLHRGGLFALDISPHGVEQIRFIPIGIGFGYSVQLSGRNARKSLDQFRARCSALGTPVSSDAADVGTIALSPPRRVTKSPLPPAPYTRYDLSVLDPSIASTTAAGAVDQVPQDARIAPVRLGPLTLLGLRVDPQTITRRQMLWVESFWSCEAPIPEDIRLNIRGVPVQPTTMPVWGKRMDHDPCDWLAPTSRWQPGVIYRDDYGLRAPRMSQLLNVDLRIEVGILSRQHPDVPPYLGPVLRMAIPELGSAPAFATTPSYRSECPTSIQPCQPGQTWTAAQLQAVTGGTWQVPPPEGWFVRSAAYQRSYIDRLPKPFFFVAHALAQRLRHAQSTHPKPDYDRHIELPTLAPHCAGAMVSRPVAGLPADFPLLRVADPIQALMELGLAARQRYSGPLVAITGTAGKSTTVAMLQQMLTALSEPTSAFGDPVLATQGNYNTRIDALALLANLHPEHTAAIVEVAQSALWMKRGPVTRLIRPTMSVITEIGLSQTDRRVSSVADTAHWKSRIFDGLTGPAVAVIGEHLPYLDEIRKKAAQHAQQLLVVGESRNAQLRIRAVDSRRSGRMTEHRITLDTPQGRLRFALPLSSPGMVRNALAALAVILAMDKDLSAAAEALRHFVPNAGCLRYHDVRLRHGIVTLIDDSYNATVISMHNAFQVLAEATPLARGRKIAVLGRIVHLGELAQPLHEELAQPLLATGVEQVITHGPEMRFLRAKLPADRLGPHCSQAQEVVRHLHDLAQDGDLILIKGSRRASDFGEILRLLIQPGRQDAEHASSGIPAPLSRSAPPPSRAPASVFAFTEDLLLQAAARRNLKITRHPARYFEIAQHGRGAIFRRNSPDHSVLAATITADKRRTKQLLDLNGLPTQNGTVFGNLQSAQAFFIRFQAEHTDRARHVRVMVLGGRAVGAYECVPITLTGNGRDTVAGLIQARTERRSSNPWLSRWPVVQQEVLAQSGWAMETILDPGTCILLSHVASIANGSDTVTLTETIHVSLLTLAEQAVHCFPGLHLAGVSLLCEAPERDLASQRAVILDIDGKPAIADLAFPTSGPALDLSNDVLDYALDPTRQQTPSDQPPCLRPAPPFTPAADTVFALDSRLEVQLLRHAARSRGLKAERLSSKLTRIADADSQCLFYRTMSPGTRIVARRATNTHKSWAKQLLRAAGLPTPNGQAFAADQQAAAWAYLQRQSVPAVIKPQSGSWGRGVTTNVTQREHFDDAWRLAIQTKATTILVEEYVPGTLYRLFVVGNTLVAAAEILPAHITGDGQQSIRALVDAQNLQREQDPGLAQCPIVLGPSALRQLQAQGLNPNAIPDAERAVQLDTVANTGVGGTSQDVTENVHPDFAPLVVKARLAVFNPPHVGIDLVAQDISLPPDKQAWSIIEVNTNPDLSVHHFPTAGQARNVAGVLIESLFLAYRTNDCSFRLRPSTIPDAGIGVFALHDIEKDTFLAVKPQGTAVGKTVRRDKIPEELRAYCIEKRNGLLRCPREFSHLHLVWFLNHSDTPNAEKRKDGFYAKTKILSGEEILIDYETL